jgi:flagellar hook-associated protein 1
MSSLFTSLGMAESALKAAGTAVRTVGQNISNADTEGYTRQRVEMAARQSDHMGRVQVGTGVDVTRVARIMDQRLEEMIREGGSTLGDLMARDDALGKIESILGDLDSSSIGSALSQFFDAAESLVNHPEDATTRTLFAARGDDLSRVFNSQDTALRGLREDLEQDVRSSVEEVNRLTSQIASLNDQIVTSELGGTNLGTANDLRDRREALVKNLSELVSVKAVETSSGSMNILAGSDFLVVGDQAKNLVLDTKPDGDVAVSTIRFESDGKSLILNGGKLAGLVTGRDQTVPQIRGELDQLAKAIISEVNQIHSQGVGLSGWGSMTGTVPIDDPSAALTADGLLPPVQNGSFDLKVHNQNTGLDDTYNIAVDPGTSLDDLASLISAAVAADHPSMAASVTSDGRLKIESGDSNLTFSFASDTSKAMAALGMGTFFSGSSAADMAVSQAVVDDPRLIATGQGGGPTDPAGIAAIAGLRDRKVLDAGGATMEEFFQGAVGVLGVQRSRAKDLLANQTAVSDHLSSERAAISGVDLDEESIDLIRYQRAYQGAARFLSVVDSLLESLLNA